MGHGDAALREALKEAFGDDLDLEIKLPSCRLNDADQKALMAAVGNEVFERERQANARYVVMAPVELNGVRYNCHNTIALGSLALQTNSVHFNRTAMPKIPRTLTS